MLAFFLLLFSAFVNLLTVFTPETGFDALWYHLTLPKLYLQTGNFGFIPGGLLYYSVMPRLGEFIYLLPLQFFGITGVHFVNWLFGIGTAVVTYLLAREYLSKKDSTLASAIAYLTPIISWQSGSAYIDLIRTFFEVLAFSLLTKKHFFLTGIAIGLAISTKTLSLGSLFILLSLGFFITKNYRAVVKIIIGSLISLPWFVYAFAKTSYPFYPIGAGILDQTHNLLPGLSNPFSLITDFYQIFVLGPDLINPIFFIFIPLFFLSIKKYSKKEILLFLYFLLTALLWWATPRTGGGRFILPYLPAWSVLIVLTLGYLKNNILKKFLLFAIFLTLFVNLLFRLGALSRLLPIVTKHQSETEYLCAHLDFNNNFVDCDGWFRKNIKKTDLILVNDIHNLFYINFPFVHKTWYMGEEYNYILIAENSKNKIYNPKSKRLELVYKNIQTNVILYKADSK